MNDPIAGRVRNMIARGVIETADDSKKAQTLKAEMLDGEVHDDIEHFQMVGFSSVPQAGAEVIVIFAGGLRSHGIAIATVDRASRLKDLQPGECAIHDDQGQWVWIKRDGIFIETDKPIMIRGETVTIEAETATVNAETVNLGGEGGPAVARVGDTVSGGVIQSGSAKVFAA